MCNVHHLPGQETQATMLPRHITEASPVEMPVQSHSHLITCQACSFFLKPANDKRKTKDSEKQLDVAS